MPRSKPDLPHLSAGPRSLSGDRIADWDVLEHALREMEARDGVIYDIVLMLQPTSPGRTAEHVQATLATLVQGNFDAVWTVSETDSKAHPLKQLVLGRGRFARLLRSARVARSSRASN